MTEPGPANNAEECPRTTPENPLRDQLQAVIESEVYQFRERTMWWPEGEITKEIARLATRGAMEIRDHELKELRAKVAEFDHIINWHTTCASCARILDSSYQETVRAEKAEAAITRVRETCADPNHSNMILTRNVLAALAEPKEG